MQLDAIQLHVSLYGAVPKRGTHSVTLEVKLIQEFAFQDQEPLYGIFLDLCKAFNAINPSRLFHILRWYGVEEKILQILGNFWE